MHSNRAAIQPSTDSDGDYSQLGLLSSVPELPERFLSIQRVRHC